MRSMVPPGRKNKARAFRAAAEFYPKRRPAACLRHSRSRQIVQDLRKDFSAYRARCGIAFHNCRENTRNPHWSVRIPFATVFAAHGAGKLFVPAAQVVLVGIAEVLAGTRVIVGGPKRAPHRALVDRLTGPAAIPALLGVALMFLRGARARLTGCSPAPLRASFPPEQPGG